MLDWIAEKARWPFSNYSLFPVAEGLRWHVQMMGEGPPLLLVHGAGAAGHTWRGLLPRLLSHFRILNLDLPGHGFTPRPRVPHALSLPTMANALARLLQHLDFAPQIALGHSAGAAILASMALSGTCCPRLLVSLNGALLPLSGWRGLVFSPLARLSTRGHLLARLYAWRAQDPAAVARVIRSTGSHLDAEGVRLYQRLASDEDHVAATLQMMAQWELTPLAQNLPRLTTPLVLVAARGDTAVAPSEATRVRLRVPGSRLIELPQGGHLVHEEYPERIADLALSLAREAGVIAKMD